MKPLLFGLVLFFLGGGAFLLLRKEQPMQDRTISDQANVRTLEKATFGAG